VTQKQLATQIWPFREDFGKDMPGTLAKLAELGFVGVELCRWFTWTDMFDKWSPTELVAASEQAGINLLSTHMPSYMLEADRLNELTEFCDAVGMKYAMVASLPPEQMASKEILQGMAATFNAAAASLKSTGIRVGFHAHGPDFKPVEGAVPWEILFDNTSDDFIMQMDIGNCLSGGGDPIYYLKKYPGRASLVHIKEFGAGQPAEAIGDGVVDWGEVYTVCENLHQPEWYILEQEEKEFNPWTSAEKSLKYLRAAGL
jgi:sugar phosphate isomerase/epimerase